MSNKVLVKEVTINANDKHYENNKVKTQLYGKDINTYATRYIASYAKAGGNINSHKFVDWLESLGLDEDDIYKIKHLASSGEFNLEKSAREFLS